MTQMIRWVMQDGRVVIGLLCLRLDRRHPRYPMQQRVHRVWGYSGAYAVRGDICVGNRIFEPVIQYGVRRLLKLVVRGSCRLDEAGAARGGYDLGVVLRSRHHLAGRGRLFGRGDVHHLSTCSSIIVHVTLLT